MFSLHSILQVTGLMAHANLVDRTQLASILLSKVNKKYIIQLFNYLIIKGSFEKKPALFKANVARNNTINNMNLTQSKLCDGVVQTAGKDHQAFSMREL